MKMHLIFQGGKDIVVVFNVIVGSLYNIGTVFKNHIGENLILLIL